MSTGTGHGVETPFFFEGPSARLFGVLHEPAGGAREVPFVFCHAFAEEKLWSHRVMVTSARALSGAGHPVLRFDCMGYGDSRGEFEAITLTTCRADIEAAMDELMRRTGADRAALLGLRLGATLAAEVSGHRRDVDRLVCWAPILDGSAYLQELLRINVTTQLAVYREVREDRDALMRALESGHSVNVDGYDLGPAMARELRSLSMAANPPALEAPTLIAQVDRNPAATPGSDLRGFQERGRAASLAVVREEPFWKEISRFYNEAPGLLDATMRWLGHRR